MDWKRQFVDTLHDRTDAFQHNLLGQVIWHKDALGYIETAFYNVIGQKENFTDKNLKLWVYKYDVAGNLVKETAPEVAAKAGSDRSASRPWRRYGR